MDFIAKLFHFQDRRNFTFNLTFWHIQKVIRVFASSELAFEGWLCTTAYICLHTVKTTSQWYFNRQKSVYFLVFSDHLISENLSLILEISLVLVILLLVLAKNAENTLVIAWTISTLCFIPLLHTFSEQILYFLCRKVSLFSRFLVNDCLKLNISLVLPFPARPMQRSLLLNLEFIRSSQWRKLIYPQI